MSKKLIRFIRIGLPQQEFDHHDDSIDVIVEMENGRVFSATYFTLKNIDTIFRRNNSSGECNHGQYFWASNMIIVESLTKEVVSESISDLVETGEFYNVFAEIDPLPTSG